jgi:deoxyribose-phosphate aldolase
VPMLYTGGGFKGYDATYGYVARSLRLLRAAVGTGVPVHAAGGVANRMSAEELKAFTDAVLDDGTVTGWSLYDLQTSTPTGWAAMARLSEALG